MKKYIFCLCFISLFGGGKMFALVGNDNDYKPLKSALRQYGREHIMPVLVQKRLELDRELSPAERSEIAQCRTVLKQLRQQEREVMKQKPDSISMHVYMEQGHNGDIRKQRKAIIERLQKIADKHSNTLDKFKTDLEPNVKQWKEDITRMLTRKGDSAATNNNAVAQQQEHKMRGGFLHSLTGPHAQAYFLLVSVKSTENEDALSEFNSAEVPSAVSSANNDIPAFKLMPNPASTEIIVGNSPIPAVNELKIYDIQGKAVFSAQNVKSAQHLNVSSLANGTYTAQFKSGDQQQNQQVVISHK